MVACRSAPLSLSLFGEDSATSFADEPQAALEVGPLWTPAWLAPPSPASSSQTQHVQHAQQPQHDHQPHHAQRAQPASDAQHQQQSDHSQPAAIPNVLLSQQALLGTKAEADFGSFTGNQRSSWLPSSQVESAQDYIATADQQAPSHFQSVTSNAANDGDERSGAADKPLLRPAAAAVSLQPSMDRSAPISLGLFGEESFDDPVLDVPGQAAVQDTAVDLQQGAVPRGPQQMPSASAERPATTAEQATSLQQPHTAQHEFRPRRAFPPQMNFQAEHDFEPSWQHAHTIGQPVKPSLTFTPDTADDDFSPSWQQAGGNENFGYKWQNETASGVLSPTATAFDSPHAFAATWSPLSTDADSASRQQLPGRQALSGPISLEHFGMEEQEDQPLEHPTEALINTLSAPQPYHAAVDDEQQQSEDRVHPQQLAAACQSAWQLTESTQQSALGRQASPGPISLELFGMEETQDAPLELPVQATITVLPTAAPDTSNLASLTMPTGTFSFLQSSKQVYLYVCHHSSVPV